MPLKKNQNKTHKGKKQSKNNTNETYTSKQNISLAWSKTTS